MRYNQLMESTQLSVRDLNLSPDFWKSERVRLQDNKLDSLDGCPDEILGDFVCCDNNLTSLAGGPKTVGGNFLCWKNNLTSLVGVPETIGGGFYCADNQLTSLAGAPTTMPSGGFDCDHNQLTSLAGAPRIVGGGFLCSNNKLTSLVHAPETIKGSFYCADNQLTSLVGCPKTIGGDLDCSSNRLTSLADIHTHVQQMNGKLKIGANPINSHILGILLIKGCQRVISDYSRGKKAKLLKQAVEILNKHLGQGRAGIMDCQAEMLAAGLDDFAQI